MPDQELRDDGIHESHYCTATHAGMNGIERSEGDPITVRTEYASAGGDPFVVVEIAGVKGATTLGMRREEAAELRDALTRELNGP